jgi:hypothetical protein
MPYSKAQSVFRYTEKTYEEVQWHSQVMDTGHWFQ